jgi:hypothetical protein
VTIETTIQLAGIVTLAGAVMYAIADVLLLAYNVGPRQEIPSTAIDFETSERWKRRAGMLICMSRMPWKRLQLGGLLGVCMTPLVMAGAWVLYHALSPAGPWFSVPVAVLWLAAYPIGAFIHGSFIYFGGAVHGWNAATGEIKDQLGDIVYRMLRVLIFSYLVFFVLAIATSVWYVVAVLQGTTALPTWMAIMNPALMTIVYMLLARRVIPFRVIKHVQGAGFNIVYIVFFALLLAFVW